MTEHDTKQEHPGAEWVEIYHPPTENRRGEFRFFCPGLNLSVWWETPDPAECRSRAEAIERCRAISAAALAWESTKADRGLKELIAKLEQIEKALPALRLLKELAQ